MFTNDEKMEALQEEFELRLRNAADEIISDLLVEFSFCLKQEQKQEKQVISTITSEEPNLEITVGKYLRELGISTNYRGYLLLQNAIIMCIEDPSLSYNLQSSLYPAIREKVNFYCTISSVERGIRNAIKNAKEQDDDSLFYTLFNKNRSITNSLFITTVTEAIREKL